jgi:hypothetical protein
MSGNSFAALLVTVLSLFPATAPAGQKKPSAFGIVSGTVFRDPGYALTGARVVLFLRTDPKPKKLQEAVTNYRGEFLFHVPSGQATYLVRASSNGYHPEEKEAAIAGEERAEVSLVLSPENK